MRWSGCWSRNWRSCRAPERPSHAEVVRERDVDVACTHQFVVSVAGTRNGAHRSGRRRDCSGSAVGQTGMQVIRQVVGLFQFDEKVDADWRKISPPVSATAPIWLV